MTPSNEQEKECWLEKIQEELRFDVLAPLEGWVPYSKVVDLTNKIIDEAERRMIDEICRMIKEELQTKFVGNRPADALMLILTKIEQLKK